MKQVLSRPGMLLSLPLMAARAAQMFSRNSVMRWSWARFVASFAAGIVVGFGFAPYRVWVAAIVGFAWFIAIAMTARPTRSFLHGFCFGLGLFVPPLTWLFSGVDSGHSPILAAIGPMSVMLVLALFSAVSSAVAAAIPVSSFYRMVLLLPSLWVVGEWVRHQGILAFPWLTVGYTQIPNSPLSGYATVLGILGTSLATLATAGLVAWMVSSRGFGRQLHAVIALALTLACGHILGGIEWTKASGSQLEVALLQGNAPLTEKFSPSEVNRALKTYASLAVDSNARFVVMPETAFPMFEHQVPADFRAFLRKLALERQGDIIISHFRNRAADPSQGYFSSAHSIGVSGDQYYDKQHLLPFGEFIPFGAWFRPIYERIAKVHMLDTSPGVASLGSLVFGGQRAAIRMCYEDVFGNERRQAIGQSKFLLTLVNDSWDNETVPMDQHLQISQARAIEAGKPLLRAANTGWTVAIDHHGKVVGAVPARTVGGLIAQVQPRSGTTPYVLAGDSLPMGLAMMGVLVAATGMKRKQMAQETREWGAA